MITIGRAVASLLMIALAVATQAAVPESERQALVDLYDTTNGDDWTNKTGWKGAAGTECMWFGVTCDGDNVAELSLRANNLVGEIPRSLLNLTKLSFLSIDYNGLSSADPAVVAFVNARTKFWADSQTAPPTGIVARADNRSTVTVSWTINPNLQTSRYEAVSSAGQTLTVPYGRNSATFTNLDSTKSYDFRVRMITEPNPNNPNRVESRFSSPLQASPGPEPRTFDIGVPKTHTLWVDPVNGNDANDGETRLTAMKTINAAWGDAGFRVSNASGAGVEIVLTPGDYPAESFTTQFGRYGSHESPTIIRAEFPHTARLHGQLTLGGTNVYLIGVTIDGPASFYLIQGVADFLLLRDVHVTGGTGILARASHVYLENVRVEDSTFNGIDFDHVHYGHVINSRVARATASCMTLTEASAYLTIDSNDFGPCVSGIDVGGVSFLDRLVSPWIQYDAYDIKLTNNVIHDNTVGAVAFGGSYNLLIAHNTIVKPSGGMFIFAAQSRRLCGDPAKCQTFHDAGGWGPTASGITVPIPNRNVSIFNNIFYTRGGTSQTTLLNVSPAVTMPPTGTNVPVPTRADDNLQIRGNLVWSTPLVPISGAACDNSNPTCNAAQLMVDNRINVIQPQLIDPDNGNYRPVANGNLFGLAALAIPSFTWTESVPTGELTNTVARDADNVPRTIFVPGAFTRSLPVVRHRATAPH